MTIPFEQWAICKICGTTLEEMIQTYKKPGMYKNQYFKQHLHDKHGMSLTEYFPEGVLCPCNICNKRVGIKLRGATIEYKKMACGRNPGLLEWSERAKIDRRGNGNPMFQKDSWNKGHTKNSSSSLQRVSEALTNREVSDETRKKQSESAKKRNTHGHTGCKHSEYSKQIMREKTLEFIRNGGFKHTNTKPFLRMESILQDLGIRYEKEKIVAIWSFDFYLPDLEVYIEVDGDYFHSHPKRYPNGPVTNTQKINFYRDKKKNQYCQDNNIQLLRFWESEIYEEEPCVRQKLLALSQFASSRA